jgi:DNA-binding MarR family transcriptional regulator
MDIEEFSRRMNTLLPQFAKHSARYGHNYLTRGKITLPQFWALEYLFHRGPSQMSDLAEFLQTSRPAATGIIDRLVAQGLVKRQKDMHDRRVVRIELSPQGSSIAQDILKQRHRALVHVFGKISPSDRTQYLHILEQVVTILNETQAQKDNRKTA